MLATLIAVLVAVPAQAARPDQTDLRRVRVLVVGDSLTVQSDAELRRQFGNVRGFDTRVEGHNGSGLINGFDWNRRFRELVAEFDPDVVVAEFVGNYLPPLLRRNDRRRSIIALGEPEFYARWTASAENATRVLSAGGASVYWLLGPQMGNDLFHQLRRRIDDVYLGLGDRLPVRYVDTYAAFGGPNGEYVEEMPTMSGSEQVRTSDGVHLTPAGARRFAEAIVKRVETDHSLRPWRL